MVLKAFECCHITAAGLRSDYKYQICAQTCRRLAASFPKRITITLVPCTDGEYSVYLEKTRPGLGTKAAGHKSSPLVFYNGVHYIGSELDFALWARRAFEHTVNPNTVLFHGVAKQETRQFLCRLTERQGSSFVYMDLARNGQSLGRIIIELFRRKCPRTCENFSSLCTGVGRHSHGHSYVGSLIHRVVPGAWIQGGDVVGGHGDGGAAAITPDGGAFGDENFSVPHDRPGIVGMASSGPHTNRSQFYITHRPMPWLDRKCVAFGRVVQGMRVVSVVSKAESRNQRPLEPIVVAACGCLIPQRKEDRKARQDVHNYDTRRPATKMQLLAAIFADAAAKTAKGKKTAEPPTIDTVELVHFLTGRDTPLWSHFPKHAKRVVGAVAEHGLGMMSKNVFIGTAMGVVDE